MKNGHLDVTIKAMNMWCLKSSFFLAIAAGGLLGGEPNVVLSVEGNAGLDEITLISEFLVNHMKKQQWATVQGGSVLHDKGCLTESALQSLANEKNSALVLSLCVERDSSGFAGFARLFSNGSKRFVAMTWKYKATGVVQLVGKLPAMIAEIESALAAADEHRSDREMADSLKTPMKPENTGSYHENVAAAGSEPVPPVSVRRGRKIVVPMDFPTIHSAMGEADAGDTVFVCKGVYHENIALADEVALIGQDMLNTVIDGRGKGPCIIGADGTVISNFTIRNGKSGILCKNSRPVIRRNRITRNKGAGIHALISLPDINNNVIDGNGLCGIFLESSRSARTSIDHNVILKNRHSGIYCARRTEVLIRNNILIKNGCGITVDKDAKRTKITNNNFFKNSKPFNHDAIIDPTNIAKDPMFVDPGKPYFNYFCKPVSLCKGRGEEGTDIGLISEQSAQPRSTDRDGDGIPDEIDQCPDVPEDQDGFEDRDGCPDYDNDKDGIYDARDQCPNDPEDRDGFDDADGCQDYDNDKDGISDSVDKCPNDPETFNGNKDEDGCPDKKPIETMQGR
jgi:OmpA-OmpF porin, OOP family